MIQRRQRARLPPEASQPLRVARKFIGQGLDGDIPLELAVVRAVYFSHTARAEQRHDLVRSEFPAQQRASGRLRDRYVLNRWSFQEAPGSFFVRQQSLDLPAQLS